MALPWSDSLCSWGCSRLWSAEGLQGSRRQSIPVPGTPGATQCSPGKSSLKIAQLPNREQAAQNGREKTPSSPVPVAPPCLQLLRAGQPGPSLPEIDPALISSRKWKQAKPRQTQGLV